MIRRNFVDRTGMHMASYYDRVHFSLSDESGDLRFKTFDISDAPECSEMEAKLREYLLMRPLAEIDAHEIRRVAPTADPAWMEAIIQVVEDAQVVTHLKKNNG